jgi:hypothetical protein
MKIFSFLASVAFFFGCVSAQAGVFNFSCTPAHPSEHPSEHSWFQSLNLQVSSNLQVSGNYTGYQNENKTKRVSLDDQTLFFKPVLSAALMKNGIAVRLDFKGSMGSDEDDFTFTLANNGVGTLTGRTMADCGDGQWSAIGAETYECQSL